MYQQRIMFSAVLIQIEVSARLKAEQGDPTYIITL